MKCKIRLLVITMFFSPNLTIILRDSLSVNRPFCFQNVCLPALPSTLWLIFKQCVSIFFYLPAFKPEYYRESLHKAQMYCWSLCAIYSPLESHLFWMSWFKVNCVCTCGCLSFSIWEISDAFERAPSRDKSLERRLICQTQQPLLAPRKRNYRFLFIWKNLLLYSTFHNSRYFKSP